MKSKFIVNGYKINSAGEIGLIGNMEWKSETAKGIQSGELEVCFKNYFEFKKFIDEMGCNIKLPKEMRWMKNNERKRNVKINSI